MVKMIKTFWLKLKKRLSYNTCYNEMERKGDAVFGICSGVSGSSDYVEIGCIECPYLNSRKEDGEV